MSALEHIILIGSILLTGILSMSLSGKVKKLSKAILAFSGAFLVSITFLHLFPIIYHSDNHTVGVWVIAGFFGQLFLEQFSSGVEHGHTHVHDHRNSVLLIVQVMAGLTIHSFVEGLSLGGFETHAHDHHQHSSHLAGEHLNPLLVGIVLHHVPAAFALMMVLASSGLKKWSMLLCLLVFAITPSLGAMTVVHFNFDQNVILMILAFVSGSFLHVATTILFETDDSNHKVPYKTLLAALSGVLLSLLTV